MARISYIGLTLGQGVVLGTILVVGNRMLWLAYVYGLLSSVLPISSLAAEPRNAREAPWLSV